MKEEFFSKPKRQNMKQGERRRRRTGRRGGDRIEKEETMKESEVEL